MGRAGMYKFFTVLKRVKGPLLVESVSVSLPCTDWAETPECMKEARWRDCRNRNIPVPVPE